MAKSEKNSAKFQGLAEEYGLASDRGKAEAIENIRESLSKHLTLAPKQRLLDASTLLFIVIPHHLRYVAEDLWGRVQGETYNLTSDVQNDFFWRELEADFKSNYIPEDNYLDSLRMTVELKDSGWSSYVTDFFTPAHTTTLLRQTLEFLGVPYAPHKAKRVAKLLYIGADRGSEIHDALESAKKPTFRSVCRQVRELIDRDAWDKEWELSSVYRYASGNDGDLVKTPDDSWAQVYLMELFTGSHKSQTGQYKIGVSKDPELRRKQIENGVVKLPIETHVVHAFPCENAYAAEKILHRTFHIDRTKGEWFSLKTQDLDWVKRIKSFDSVGAFSFQRQERRPEYSLIEYNPEVIS